MANALHCDALVLVPQPEAFAGVRDRIQGPKRRQANGFRTVQGRFPTTGVTAEVVAATPATTSDDLARVVVALVSAHRPSRVVAAGFVSTDQERPAWSAMIAARCVSSRAEDAAVSCQRLRVDAEPALFASGQHGASRQHGLNSEALKDAVVARSDWAFAVAAACGELGRPFAVVGVALPKDLPPPPRGLPTTDNAPSFARRAGALVGWLTRGRGETSDAWRRKEAIWEGQECLAELIGSVIAAQSPQPL